MINFRLSYTHPWLLLLLIPAAILTLIPHFKVVKKYRRTRNRIISLTLHLFAMVLCINLLAGLTFRYEIPNLDNEVILLVDSSDSGEDEREDKNAFVQSVINVAGKEYKVGIVKFGYGQSYVAELSGDTESTYTKYLESADPDGTATDLASALEYAKGLFTKPDGAKIVVISDGMETDREAALVIKEIAAEGIKVDTVFFPGEEHAEMQIVAVNTPQRRISADEEFTVEVAVRSNLGSNDKTANIKVYDNGNLLKTAEATVANENTLVSVPIALDGKGMHELRFELEASGDKVSENNVYHTYMDLDLLDSVLLIERYENESAELQSLLREEYSLTAISIEKDAERMPKDIYELSEYEQVILVNVAYKDMPEGFEALLNRYVYDLGGGLFTVGGKNDTVDGKLTAHSYNREDMASSTYLKQMLPVNVVDHTPPIAVMIVVDCSDSMNTDGKIVPAMQCATACLDVLSDRDFCGVMSFQSDASEELQVLPVSQKNDIIKVIETLNSDANSITGGTVFSSAIQDAGRALSVIDNVKEKHIVLITDGEPSDTFSEYAPYIQDNNAIGITMSVVTVEVKGNFRQNMVDTAEEGNGKFYNVTRSEINKIPNEMRQILTVDPVAEINYGKNVSLEVGEGAADNPIISGISAPLPALTGYYGTFCKDGASAILVNDYVPIYAQWKYGEGNVGSFMSALGGEWSSAFINDDAGKSVIINIVNNLFPMHDVRADKFDYVIKTDNYTTSLNVHGVEGEHRVEVEVATVFESLAALVGNSIPVNAAESNRRFTFEIKTPGLYMIKIRELDETGALVSEAFTYKTFSYSEEYNEFTERQPIGDELLLLLASDGGGAAVTDPVDVFEGFEKTLKREYDPRILFLILAIVAIVLDIAVRKFKFKWPHELIREYKQRKADNAENKGDPRSTR